MADEYNTNLTLDISSNMAWTFKDALGLSNTIVDANSRQQAKYNNGTGNNQFNEIWHDRRTLTPATTLEEFRLDDASGGTRRENAFGREIGFDTIKLFALHNLGVPDGSGGHTPTAGHTMYVGFPGVGYFGGWFVNTFATSYDLVIPSGGLLYFETPLEGYNVGASELLQIYLDAGATSDIEFDIIIAGERDSI